MSSLNSAMRSLQPCFGDASHQLQIQLPWSCLLSWRLPLARDRCIDYLATSLPFTCCIMLPDLVVRTNTWCWTVVVTVACMLRLYVRMALVLRVENIVITASCSNNFCSQMQFSIVRLTAVAWQDPTRSSPFTSWLPSLMVSTCTLQAETTCTRWDKNTSPKVK